VESSLTSSNDTKIILESCSSLKSGTAMIDLPQVKNRMKAELVHTPILYDNSTSYDIVIDGQKGRHETI
jgi:hypothetical protein